MVRDAHDAVADDPGGPPRILRQPADAPPPLGQVGSSAALMSFRGVWTSWHAPAARSLRAWAGRVSGRSDRRLLGALAEATDAIATQCDLLTDRLTAREAVSADVAESFGEEVARLRAELAHLQRLVATSNQLRGG
jgi:hypothetical protein